VQLRDAAAGGDGPGIAALIAAALGDELEGTPWGGPPRLYTIWLRDQQCELRPVALPPQVWETMPPPAVLSVVVAAASALAADPGYRPPAGLYGAAFRAEAFSVSRSALGDEEFDRAVRAQISAHPARAEMRMLYAIDVTGVTYRSVQARGDQRLVTQVERPGADTVVSGPVPEAVTLLLGELIRWPGREPDAGEPEAGP